MRQFPQKLYGGVVAISFLIYGCASAQKIPQKNAISKESPQETQSALQSVAGALTGKAIDERELRNIVKQAQTHPEAKSSLGAIEGAMSQQKVIIKYCPVDGARFSSHLDECPQHRVTLKIVE